jgi:hypothetical protein
MAADIGLTSALRVPASLASEFRLKIGQSPAWLQGAEASAAHSATIPKSRMY